MTENSCTIRNCPNEIGMCCQCINNKEHISRSGQIKVILHFGVDEMRGIIARRRFVTFTVSFLYAYLIAFYCRQYKNNCFLTFATVRVVDVGDHDLWTTKGFLKYADQKKNLNAN